MAALKITPGLISKLTTSLSSTWFRGANPSATSQMFLSRGYATDVVLGSWLNEGRESWQELGKELGVHPGTIARNTYNDYVLKIEKDGDGYKVVECVFNGLVLDYKIPAKGKYQKKMPMYATRMTCTPKFLDNGIQEKCSMKHPQTGEKIQLVSDRYVENGRLKEKVTYKNTTMILDFRKV